MSYFSVDIEADGPVPGPYSMVSFGIVKVDYDLKTTFYGKVKPISDEWIPEALAVSGISRDEHNTFSDPSEVMDNCRKWLYENSKGRAVFVSDNPVFDWQFINYYFHVYSDGNPFGHSGRRIADMFCGFYKDPFYRWKKHRKTKHDHNPVNDAKGNAEALLYLREQGFKFPIK